MFLQPAPSSEGIPASAASRFALTIAGAAMIWMGIAPGIILTAAESAATVLAGVTAR
jgi:hypothetical protein